MSKRILPLVIAMSKVPVAFNSPREYKVAGKTVEITIIRGPRYGGLIARIRRGPGSTFMVPVGLCAAGAGPDAWMREIPVPCACCGKQVQAQELDGADMCPGCYAKLGEAIQD